jgi:hypothetical protein
MNAFGFLLITNMIRYLKYAWSQRKTVFDRYHPSRVSIDVTIQYTTISDYKHNDKYKYISRSLRFNSSYTRTTFLGCSFWRFLYSFIKVFKFMF